MPFCRAAHRLYAFSDFQQSDFLTEQGDDFLSFCMFGTRSEDHRGLTVKLGSRTHRPCGAAGASRLHPHGCPGLSGEAQRSSGRVAAVRPVLSPHGRGSSWVGAGLALEPRARSSLSLVWGPQDWRDLRPGPWTVDGTGVFGANCLTKVPLIFLKISDSF